MSKPRLIVYPRRGIDYCEQLYRVVAEMGTQALEGKWSVRWILANVRRNDLVHLHWPSFFYFHANAPMRTHFELLRLFLRVGVVRLLGARIAWTAHNLYPHDGGRNRWTHRVARKLISRVAEVIFVHGPTAARLVSGEFHIPARKLRQVPHGHWRDLYPQRPDRAEARRRIGMPADAVLYGFVGACRPYKNLESVVSAFAQVDPASHLLIAGKFSPAGYLETIRALIDPACEARIHIVPRFLQDEEIMAYVAGLDALVLSYKEILTSGGAMLALSAGVPVVAPRIGSLPDVIVESCGVLYDPGAPDGLANAMVEVRRRKYSRETIIAHALSFDWRISAHALIDCLGGKPKRAQEKAKASCAPQQG